MATAGPSKRRKVNSTNNNDNTIEILRGDDSGEEFSGFEESDYESEDELDEINDSEWKAGCSQDPGSRQVLREFEQCLSGIRTNELPNQPTVLDYYKLFLPDRVFVEITAQTNR